MIEDAVIYAAAATLYAIAAIVLAVLTRRQPARLRRYCYPFVGIVGLSAIATALVALGVGEITVGAVELVIPQTIDDLVGYTFVFGFAAFAAGASWKLVGTVVVTFAIMRMSYQLADAFEGVLGLVGIGVIVGGYLFLVYLFFGPIAAVADRQADTRRLLFWKFRNLALFAFGMLIVWAMLSLGGAFDAFTTTVTLEYIDIVLRIGFAGFLIGNVSALDTESEPIDSLGGHTPPPSKSVGQPGD